MKLDRLDRYVSRYFWTSTGVVFLFFFGFFVVIDLFTHADEFISTTKKIGIPARQMALWVAGFYAYKSPSIFLQIAPFVTVIGAIVAVARMINQNEVVPVLMSGRSIYRMVRPIFFWAALLLGVMLAVQEFLAPAASERRVAIERKLREGSPELEVDGPIPDEQGNLWTRIRLDLVHTRLLSASLCRIDDNGLMRAEVHDADWDAARGAWMVSGGVHFMIDDDKGHRENVVPVLVTSLTPRQITAEHKEPFDLSFAELGGLFRVTKQPRFEVLMHYHVTFPVANLLLLLLALPFVLHYDRQRVLQGFTIAFLLCGAYFAVDAALRGLGERNLHPVLAAWFAPLFFGALGISLFDGVRT